jgi:hypothetical protein
MKIIKPKKVDIYFEARKLKNSILHIELLPSISLTFDRQMNETTVINSNGMCSFDEPITYLGYKQCSVILGWLLFSLCIDINYKINKNG